MFVLSELMCERVGIAAGSTPIDLLDHLRAGNLDVLDGLLATEPSKAAAAQSLEQLAGYELRIVEQVADPLQKFCSVQFDSHDRPVFVGLVSHGAVVDPPTALENLIFWAAVNPQGTWHQVWRDERTGAVVDWRALARGKAIIAEPSGLKQEERRVVAALFGLGHPEMGVSSGAPKIAFAASEIRVAGAPELLGLTQSKLLYEATAATHPKWRCLSLYRILENAYLSNVKKALLDDFDLDAGRAIEEAKKKLASELNQLVYLAEKANLIAEFLAFDVEIDALLATTNQFITMLDRGARAESLYSSPEKYKKAVLRFYKLRCSIAHAGTSSVIYEQFADADAAALAVLPTIEAIALKSLRISVVG